MAHFKHGIAAYCRYPSTWEKRPGYVFVFVETQARGGQHSHLRWDSLSPRESLQMDEPAEALTADDLHLSNVDRTLRELQRMVKEQEETLNKVCSVFGRFPPPQVIIY